MKSWGKKKDKTPAHPPLASPHHLLFQSEFLWPFLLCGQKFLDVCCHLMRVWGRTRRKTKDVVENAGGHHGHHLRQELDPAVDELDDPEGLQTWDAKTLCQ